LPWPRLTLGGARRVLEDSKDLTIRLGLTALWDLATNRDWGKWLKDFTAIRNDAQHVKPLSKDRVRRRWAEIFVPEGESRLERVVLAKTQIRQKLEQEQPTNLGPLLTKLPAR